jgi:uncharacterized repeat protein (TIGR04076 family)
LLSSFACLPVFFDQYVLYRPVEETMDLIIKVKEIKGHCPVYNTGDVFKLEDGYRLTSNIPLCMHALASIMPFYNALRVSSPSLWGLADSEGDSDRAYFQCPDALPYTGGGTVYFEVSKSERAATT